MGVRLDLMGRWCAVIALGLPVASAAAQEREAAIVGVEEDLAERIRGQTSDLPWTLRFEEGPAPEDLEAAHGAPVVVWVDVRGETLVLHVADVRARRMFVRELGRPEEEFGESAQQEAVALALRSALQALALGGEIGVAVPAAEEPSEVSEVPEAPPEVSEVPEGPAVSRWTLDASVGWHAALDGASPVQQGPAASLGVGGERWRVGLALEPSLGAELEDALTSVTLHRHVAGVVASLRFGVVELGLRLGGAVYRRSTTSRSEARATEARTYASLLAGAELAVAARLVGPLAIRIGVGADVLPMAPTLQYQTGAGRTTRDRVWPVSPHLAVTIGAVGE